eukprot:8165160-Ditylum_brightwellii.AAC.1
MAHKTDQENSSGEGAFCDGFNPGPQVEEDRWMEVNNKKPAAKETKANKRKNTKIRGFKRKI